MGNTSVQLKSEDVKAEAANLGFSLVGIAPVTAPLHGEIYRTWINAGRQGSMDYLSRIDAVSRRLDPSSNLPGARSVISVGLRYPAPGTISEKPGCGRIAAYAWGVDYHLLISPRLEALADKLRIMRRRAFSDSAPVLERDFAQQSGLGWIGKNTCLIVEGKGSYYLLGELFCENEIEPDLPFQADRCGSCQRCVMACPTQAILPDRTIDARRCISYLTIENKGDIPADLRPLVGNWVFGCDICQQVCPWNRAAGRESASPALEVNEKFGQVELADQLGLSQADFSRIFHRSPILRAKRRGYLRNVCVAAGNSGDRGLVPSLVNTAKYEAEPLIRSHAVWALGRLGGTSAKTALDALLAVEEEAAVRQELLAALEAIP